MKKIIAAAAALLISGFAFAQGLTLEVGPRAGDELNIFDFKNGDGDDYVDELAVHSGFSISAFANIGLPFVDGLGIQPEVGFHVHEVGYKPKYGDEDDTKSFYLSLDIPVLVTYKINVTERFFIRPEVGPKVSFVLGKIYDKDWDKIDTDLKTPFNFGLTAGVCFGINVGPGAIVIDARYNRDFTKIILDNNAETEIGSAQSIELSVGYAFKIM
ncbi:MAG: PorT family protein [Treponema sp.]|nr:PorT family protein [Treponema sp.]